MDKQANATNVLIPYRPCSGDPAGPGGAHPGHRWSNGDHDSAAQAGRGGLQRRRVQGPLLLSQGQQ